MQAMTTKPSIKGFAREIHPNVQSFLKDHFYGSRVRRSDGAPHRRCAAGPSLPWCLRDSPTWPGVATGPRGLGPAAAPACGPPPPIPSASASATVTARLLRRWPCVCAVCMANAHGVCARLSGAPACACAFVCACACVGFLSRGCAMPQARSNGTRNASSLPPCLCAGEHATTMLARWWASNPPLPGRGPHSLEPRAPQPRRVCERHTGHTRPTDLDMFPHASQSANQLASPPQGQGCTRCINR